MRLIYFSILFICFQLQGQDWVQVNSLPNSFNETHHSFGFALDDIGYIVTGGSESGMRDDFYQYNPVTDTWTELPPFPGGARGFAIGDIWDGKAYFGFGDNGSSLLDDLWVFDPADMSWTELASCPCAARTHPAMIAHNGKVFVGMGGSASGNLDDWWQYDIALDTWSQKDDLPSVPRHHPYQFGIGDYVYTGFGHGEGIFNDWYRYHIDNETWQEVASLPAEGRVAGTQFSYNGMGFVLSGDGDDHYSMETGEFWAYNPTTDSWEELAPHPGTSRWAPASFIIDGEVYVINGDTFLDPGYEYVTEVYKFDIRSVTDQDQDGFSMADDCEDTNPNINPGQAEVPYNGIDDDCNPETLDDDLDQDGFFMFVDCHDTNPNINPGQTEIPYNGIDDDCNPETLEDDLDQDGFLAADDCHDTNPNINPDAEEIPDNGIDEDCDDMDLVTSIHELANTTINIYPNPTIDIINIDVSGNLQYKATLFDLQGRLIMSRTNQSAIQIESLAQGTYLLEIEDLNTHQKIVERIVKGG